MTTKLTTEEFRERSIAVHGTEKYDYTESIYVGNFTKIKIWCNTCREFFYQVPFSHWKGKGCKRCGVNKRVADRTHNLGMFIKKMQELGRPMYDYSKAEYKTTHTKMLVGCIHHGFFEVTPNKLLQNRGCPICAQDARNSKSSLGLDRFIEKSNAIHGEGAYDYSMCAYINNHTPVCIICPNCGPFDQLPQTHLQHSGCPSCAETGFNESKDGVLYVVNVEGVFNFTGFGITRDSNTRLSRHAKAAKDSGCFISSEYVSKTVEGSIVKQLETLLKQTFPLAACSRDIPGFKTESTTADYATVVAFVEDYITKNK